MLRIFSLTHEHLKSSNVCFPKQLLKHWPNNILFRLIATTSMERYILKQMISCIRYWYCKRKSLELLLMLDQWTLVEKLLGACKYWTYIPSIYTQYYYSQFFTTNNEIHEYNTRNNNNLHPTLTNLTKFNKGPYIMSQSLQSLPTISKSPSS
jgi:hypothetical protein